MGNPVVQFVITGKNSESLSEFYCSLFDWNSNGNVNGVHELDPASDSDNEIRGYIRPTTDDTSSYITIYVQVDDLQTSLEKAESLGGKTFVPPQVIPGDMGSFAMFLDPSGNTVGLYQPKA